jgi:hypothetical protein
LTRATPPCIAPGGRLRTAPRKFAALWGSCPAPPFWVMSLGRFGRDTPPRSSAYSIPTCVGSSAALARTGLPVVPLGNARDCRGNALGRVGPIIGGRLRRVHGPAHAQPLRRPSGRQLTGTFEFHVSPVLSSSRPHTGVGPAGRGRAPVVRELLRRTGAAGRPRPRRCRGCVRRASGVSRTEDPKPARPAGPAWC